MRFKKLLSVIVTAAVSVGGVSGVMPSSAELLGAVAADEDVFVSGLWEYVLVDGGVRVVKHDLDEQAEFKFDNIVTLPEKLDGKKVVSFAEGVFGEDKFTRMISVPDNTVEFDDDWLSGSQIRYIYYEDFQFYLSIDSRYLHLKKWSKKKTKNQNDFDEPVAVVVEETTSAVPLGDDVVYDLVIPEKVAGYTVRGLEYNALSKAVNIGRLTMPDTLTSLAKNDLMNSSITSVNIPKGVKGQSGKHLCPPVYGYKKSETDKNLWVIDEPAAEVVRKIFKLCIDGYGPVQIARILTEQGIPTPTAYALSQGRDNGRHNAKTYRWGANTIAHILERYEYCGHTVNFRTKMKSYKVHKIVYNPQDEWQIFENTQEPIISQQTFDLVQELRKHKRRPQRSEVVNPFAGMVYCADCGEKMYLSRRKNERPEQEHMRCSTYAKEQDKCTVHYIRTCVLNEIVLGELNKLLTMVRENENEFIQTAISNSIQRKSSELTKAKKTLKQAEKRIAELDKLFTRLYEDNVLGRLSDERFTMMSAGYEEEQAKLKATVAELITLIDGAEQKSSDVTAFLKVVHKYEHIEKLTPEIMHELIDKIIVHEPDKSSGKRVQDIEIHFRFDVAVSTISVETGKYGKKVA